MKEAFDLIRKRIDEITVDRNIYGSITGCNMGICEDDDCLKCLQKKILSIVSEVEAEFGKDINVRGNGWIPCEKELPPQPEENPEFDGKPVEMYLVSLKGTEYPWRAIWTGKNFTDGWSIVHPEAWMPLPEPYKPGE